MTRFFTVAPVIWQNSPAKQYVLLLFWSITRFLITCPCPSKTPWNGVHVPEASTPSGKRCCPLRSRSVSKTISSIFPKLGASDESVRKSSTLFMITLLHETVQHNATIMNSNEKGRIPSFIPPFFFQEQMKLFGTCSVLFGFFERLTVH